MYKINLDNKTLEQLDERVFSELNLKERDDLQEWIANQPEVLGEELLIIQKEFAEFSETRERLDLLALDKQGSLVIIENKLDDSGRDVTWQALKYASYCSRLSKENIKKIYQDYLDKQEPGAKAEENLSEFFEEDYAEIDLNTGIMQRIILIAAKFRKEVTSTVLWLLNYNLRIQCFVATPYSMGDEVFLTVNQIIPTQDAEEFMIGMAEKTQGVMVAETGRGINRTEFWKKLLSAMEQKSPEHARMFRVGKSAYISAGAGMSGVRYRIVGRSMGAMVLLRILKRNPHSQYIYDELEKRKEEIHATLGYALEWIKGKQAFAIRINGPGNISDRDQWGEMIEFQIERFIQIEKALRAPLQKIFRQLRQSQQS